MKRWVLACALVAGLGLLSLVSAGQTVFRVGIDQTMRAEWLETADRFTQATGVEVQFQGFARNSIAQQVVLESLGMSRRLEFVMIPREWGTSLARYLESLDAYSRDLGSRGADVVRIGGTSVGVGISFAPDWFLGVVRWPDDLDAALAFLAEAAGGSSSMAVGPSTTVPSVAPLGVSKAYTTQKIERTDHNPLMDGALEALLGAAQATVGTMAARIMEALPSSARAAIETVASTFGVPFDTKTNTVTVVLESRPGRSTASNVAALGALGVRGSAVDAGTSLIKVEVSLSQLGELASQLAGIAFIRPPYVPHPLGTVGQGIAAIGADAYHAAGIRGNGTKVAIIDLGFAGLSAAQASGDLPASVVQNDLTGTGLTSGITHGTAVAEIVHEIAPDAQLYLIKIGDEVDLDLAVTYCINNGIDIINHSLGWYNTNFYDGEGTIPEMAGRAISNGILWVNAAGNEAQSHWEGSFVDGNGDGWHDSDLTFYGTAGSPAIVYLTWNQWPAASSDIDLYLYDPTGNLVASSTKHQTGTEEPTESVNTSLPSTGTYRIRFNGAGSVRLELYNLYQTLSSPVASSSILAPGNLEESVTVGAVDWANYTVGPLQAYSSQGPTNDGRTKPDLVAPDDVNTNSAPYNPFPGTSGAAPHASGAAALLLSQEPTLSEPALRSRLLGHTVAMGSANLFGQGRLSLQPPVSPNQSPVAAMSYSPSAPVPGTWVQFDGSGSNDPDGTITSYSWNFGDGTTGSGATAYHRFTSDGTYVVRLTVTDDDGATDTTQTSVVVGSAPNQPPSAAMTVSPSSAQVGQPISLSGSGSSDPDGSIVSYQWSFGDGASSSGVSTSHAYSSTGTYTVRLTVTDNDGATDVETRTVTITSAPNQPPNAAMVISPSTAQVGQPISFSGSGSSDPDGSIVSYQWSFGDGASSSGQSTSHAYSFAGTYTVRLTVTDNDGATDVETRTVTITSAPNQPPNAAMTVSPSSAQVGQPISFSGSGSSDPDGSIASYQWSFGDGTSSSGQSTSHAYSYAGTYTVRLTVTDNDGATDMETRQVVITSAPNQPPVARISVSPSSGEPGDWLTFSGASSSDPDGSIVTYQWSFGDGTSGSGMTTNHAYSAQGTYTVRLTVTDNDGATDVETRQVVIQVAPQADLFVQSISHTPNEPNLGQNVTFTIVVRNGGNAGASGFRVRLAGAASSTFTYVSSLGSGSSRSVSLALPLTTSPETFTATVDDLGQVQESNEGNNTATDTVSQATPAPPTANAGGPYSSTAGQPISFNGTGSSGSITGYSWNFGDGTTGTGAILSHTYASPGTYTVQLTVTGPGGQSTSTTSATVSPAAVDPLTVQLNVAQPSYAVGDQIVIQVSLNRSAYLYICDVWPDGKVRLVYPNLYEQNPFKAAGAHTIPASGQPYTLRVADPAGTETLYAFAATGPISLFPTTFGPEFPQLSTDPAGFRDTVLASMQAAFGADDRAFDSLSFEVTGGGSGGNQPPIAAITTSHEVASLVTPVRFSGRSSSDSDGSIAAYSWEINGTYVGSGSSFNRTFDSPGVYVARLTVTDDKGATSSTEATVNILPMFTSAQAIRPDFTMTPSSASVGVPVSFDGSHSRADQRITGYSWSFGDGQMGDGRTTTHTYSEPGTYIVRLIVADDRGLRIATQKELVVQ